MKQNNSLDPTLLIRYLEAKEQLSPNERAEVIQWIQQSPENQQEWEQLKELWEKSGQASHITQVDEESDWYKVWQKMQTPTDPASVRKIPQSYRWVWQVAAAVALLITTIWGVQQFNSSKPTQSARYSYVAQDSLLLVNLPDGSQAYLNEGSELSYNEGFGSQTRTVQLVGEGYFEVVSNATIPFFVHADSTTVRVVGTSFNVKQDGQEIKVTVNSGKVAFSHHQDTLLLDPDEVGIYQPGLQLQELKNSDSNYLSWKTGTLRFDDTLFPQVVRDIARHYKVTVQIDNQALRDLQLTSTFQHQSLATVLEEIAIVLDINYTYQDKHITFFYN
ncbi:MAG: FecR domain-containing protein [Bacteroidota bacterium]